MSASPRARSESQAQLGVTRRSSFPDQRRRRIYGSALSFAQFGGLGPSSTQLGQLGHLGVLEPRLLGPVSQRHQGGARAAAGQPVVAARGHGHSHPECRKATSSCVRSTWSWKSRAHPRLPPGIAEADPDPRIGRQHQPARRAPGRGAGQHRGCGNPDIERQIAQEENALQTLLGQNPGPIAAVCPSTEPRMPVVPPGFPPRCIERRPDIRQAEEHSSLLMHRSASPRPSISRPSLLPARWARPAMR